MAVAIFFLKEQTNEDVIVRYSSMLPFCRHWWRYVTTRSVEQPGRIFEPVEYKRQKESMKFLREQLFITPTWLIDDSIIALIGTDPLVHIAVAQGNVLMRLQGSGVLMTLTRQTEFNKGMKTYPATEFLQNLKIGMWGGLYNNNPINIYRRNLLNIYIMNAASVFKTTNEIVGRNNGNGTIYYVNPDPTGNDVSSIIRAHLVSLRADILKAKSVLQGVSKAHLQDMTQRIYILLNPR